MAQRSENSALTANPASPAGRAWEVARAIHQRCCRGTACGGAYEHLREAAVAVGVLTGRPPGRPGGRPSGLSEAA